MRCNKPLTPRHTHTHKRNSVKPAGQPTANSMGLCFYLIGVAGLFAGLQVVRLTGKTPTIPDGQFATGPD